jgi:hypothetical protein
MKYCPKCNSEHTKPGRFCCRSCANSRIFTEEIKNKTRQTMLGYGAGRNLSEETKAKISIKMKERECPWMKNRIISEETRYKMSESQKGKKKSPEFKARMSELAKKNGLGGHTSKRKLYFQKKNGDIIYLQSSYEVRFAEILEELSILWSRPEPLLWLDDAGILHRYYPDFKIQDVYVDTKNSYLATKDARKIEKVCQQNNVDIRIVLEENITKEYIRSLV